MAYNYYQTSVPGWGTSQVRMLRPAMHASGAHSPSVPIWQPVGTLLPAAAFVYVSERHPYIYVLIAVYRARLGFLQCARLQPRSVCQQSKPAV